MRLPRGIVVSLPAIALAFPLSDDVAAHAPVPDSVLVQAQTPPPATAVAPAETPAATEAPMTSTGLLKRLSTTGLSRFEVQRMLNDLDDRLRRLRTSVAPADSVLRLFAADMQRIAATSRPAAIREDSETVRQLFFRYREEPSRERLRQLTAAVEAATGDFSAPTLNTRIKTPASARPYLERSAYAAVVPLTVESPLESTMLWQKLHPGDTRATPTSMDRSDLSSFFEALSDSSYAAHKASILLAYAARVGEIQQLIKLDRDELQSVADSATELTRDIGVREDAQSKLDSRLINIGMPALAAALIALLLVPRLYKSPDLQRAIFSSGLMLELMMVFLLSGTTIILGLDGRIPAEVIGTLLGGLSGYLLGRSINPLIVDRRS